MCFVIGEAARATETEGKKGANQRQSLKGTTNGRTRRAFGVREQRGGAAVVVELYRNRKSASF